MNKDKLDWVQGLRGIAALMVVITHVRYLLIGTPYESFAETYMRPGAMGVDLFFIVSGFIMVYTTYSAPSSAREAAIFMTKRVARIWPVYASVIFVGIAICIITHINISGLHQATSSQIVTSLAFLPVEPHTPPYFDLPYGIGWTLNFEMYFYLIFALSMLAGRFRWIVFFSWMCVTLIVVPAIISKGVSLDPHHDYGISIGYINQIVNPIIWDFVAGVTIGLLYFTRMRIESRAASYVAISTSIAFVAWWSLSGHADFSGISAWGFPLSLMFCMTMLANKNSTFHIPRQLVWLGEISFSLYLTHIMVLAIIKSLMISAGYSSYLKTPFTVIIIILCSIFCGAIANNILEKHLSEWVKQALLRIIEKIFSRKSAPLEAS